MRVVNNKLLKLFREGGACEWCERGFLRLQAAHLFGRGRESERRVDVRENLISLCIFCHDGHHYSRKPSLSQLVRVVALREGKTGRQIRSIVRKLQRAA